MNIKKILLSAVCILAVAGISVMGTLAYLTDSTEVVNTFTMGNVDITLDEAEVTPDGTPVDPAKRTEAGNKYKLIPGKTYTKDPTVTVVKGSEASFVRMLVTFNKLTELDTIFAPTGAKLTSIFNDYDDKTWLYAGETEDTTANTITYEFRYKEKVDGLDDNGNEADSVLPALFKTFTVPGFFTGDDLAKLVGFKITVNAHAIQAEGFDDADAAWAAFDAQVDTTAGSGNSGAQTPTT